MPADGTMERVLGEPPREATVTEGVTAAVDRMWTDKKVLANRALQLRVEPLSQAGDHRTRFFRDTRDGPRPLRRTTPRLFLQTLPFLKRANLPILITKGIS